MSCEAISQEDIKTIHSILRELDSEGYAFSVEPFDSLTLNSSTCFKDHIVTEQFNEENAAVQFTTWLVFLFIKSVNDIDSKVSSSACEIISQQLSSFVRRLRGVPGLSIETICTSLLDWFEYTNNLATLIEYFYHDELVIATNEERVRFILSDLFYSTNRDKERVFDELAESSFGKDFSSIILYNFWGQEYSSKKKNIDYRLPLTTEDREIIDNKDNRRRFFIECEQLFTNREPSKDLHQKSLFFEALFKDYIFRLRETIRDNSVLTFAPYYWKAITTVIMVRVLLSVSSPEDEQASHFDSEEYEHCYKAVSDICEDYRLNLTPGRQYCEWSASLKELDIPYANLYEVMTRGDDKFFISSSLPLNEFKLGIIEANIKPLYDSVKDFCKSNNKMNSGKLGCIKYLVSELGDYLGDNWFEKAAESICEKKGSEAKNCMRNHTDTLGIKEFSKVLHDTIPTLPWRKKTKRTIS